MNHILQMLIGCGVAVLFLILLRQVGFGQGLTFLMFVIAMLACHWSMGPHDKRHHGNHDTNGGKHHEIR